MFIHETHLPQVLTPEEYTSEDHLDKEMGAMFHDSWQFVGTLTDIPNDGDYFTFELFGKPLIVWNQGGEIHAFLNVCPHRFSMLTHNKCGHSKERLTCQYHGWEFDETGNTRKIPDARSFKPMKQGELGLVKYHTETAGRLIFVNLSENPPSLREQLGPGYEAAEELFAMDRQLFLSLDYEVECNWKIKIENSLESYHVDLVHPATFRATPEAEICFHEMEEGWTTYSTTQRAVRKSDHRLNLLVHRLAKKDFDDQYKHYHYYPSMMYGKMGLFTFAETVFPITPHRTRIIAKFFVYAGPPGRLGTRLLYRAEPVGPEVLVHRGAGRYQRHAGHPKGHAIRPAPFPRIDLRAGGALFHFQKYIHEKTMDTGKQPVVMS